MSSIEDRLLADISWREDELVILKTMCAQAKEISPRGRSLRRAYVALLYAHYEGFSKVAWEEYLIEISHSALPFGQLRSGIAAAFLKSDISRVRSSSDSTFCDDIFSFRSKLLEVVTPPYHAFETSNLWPEVFEKMMSRLGLSTTFYSPHSVILKSLVARRNDIAHGENVGITDASIAMLDKAVWDVFYNLTVVITEACATKAYRR